MSRGQLTLRIVAGGYLAYLGFGLVRDAITKRMDNFMIFLLVGIVFMVLGAVWLIQALKKYVKHDYVDIWNERKGSEEKQEDQEGQEEQKVIETVENEDTISSEQENSGKEE